MFTSPGVLPHRAVAATRPVSAVVLAAALSLLPIVAQAQTNSLDASAAKPVKATKTAAKTAPAKAAAPAKTVKSSAAGTAVWSGNQAREFSIVAKNYSEKLGAGAALTVSGDVTITSLETKLKTDAATFDRSAQIATSAGKFQFDDVQNTLIGDSGTANYKTQQADLKTAQIVVRSLPEGGAKELGTLVGDTATYNWKDREATVTGNVTLKLKGRTITADKVVYNGRDEKAVFNGNVTIVNDDGDKLTAPKATVVMKEGAEEVSLEEGATTILKVQDGSSPTQAASANP